MRGRHTPSLLGRVQVRELQERLRKENDAFVALVKPGQLDTAAALAQLDRFLDAEREMKRAQIGFMLTVKNGNFVRADLGVAADSPRTRNEPSGKR